MKNKENIFLHIHGKAFNIIILFTGQNLSTIQTEDIVVFPWCDGKEKRATIVFYSTVPVLFR
jgi:hypothetical protein